MKMEPIWLREDVVLAIHNRQLSEHGGMKGIRDKGLLESALSAPKQRFHYQGSSMEELAACYVYNLCRNHPFIDGNKRTAFICMRLFLTLNGYKLTASQEEKVMTMLGLAAGEMELPFLIDWVRANTSKLEDS